MSQQSIESYFNARKRPATDDLNYIRPKVVLIEHEQNFHENKDEKNGQKYQAIFKGNKISKIESSDVEYGINCEKKIKNTNKTSTMTTSKLAQVCSLSSVPASKTCSGQIFKRTESTVSKNNPKSKPNNKNTTCNGGPPQLKQQNLVNFIKKGHLSPHNKLRLKDNASITLFAPKDNTANVEKGLKEQNQPEKSTNMRKDQLDMLVKKELNFDEVKSKITRSAKLEELKASINRIKELEKLRKQQEKNTKDMKDGKDMTADKQVVLKKFDTIELEILTSPQKGLKTPTKAISTRTDIVKKDELMSPKNTVISKRVIFSPTKNESPSKFKVPAYERFHSLAAPEKSTLQLPYKYRCLIEIFRCTDSVCAMFYNRKEIITFKKLKPAVQRLSRKNFSESHLAQIKRIYPDAFQFTQMKMRNFGSISKQDYFQLVITPIIEKKLSDDPKQNIDDDNIIQKAQLNAMSPKVIVERLQKFTNALLDLVKIEHDKFLKSLNPPFNIPKDKITRWHPEFDLEKCPDIKEALLPRPPDIEKFSSAKDILSTARDLFNCATPMERAMINYEENQKNNSSDTSTITSAEETSTTSNNPTTESFLKGIPKSLLEKIRMKQAAKMLDSMTRNQSDYCKIIKYSRLPELARHLRNVFITEKKGVLKLEIIVKKIRNSYETMMLEDIEAHLRLISKELPEWISFVDVRKTMYVKLDRDMDLMKVIETLTNIANKKAK